MTDNAPTMLDTPPAPADLAPALGTVPELPADLTPPPPPDEKPKRPTTRAGRRASSAAKAAAKRTDSKPKTSKPTPRRASLEDRLATSIVQLGTAVMLGGSVSGSAAVQADGQLIVQHAPSVANALANVAKDNPRVATALENMLTAGVWGGLAAAVIPLLLGIAANHNAIPPGVAALLGVGQVPADLDQEAASA